jgi:catechol 2,3-dioxygenase-like lactoylglutathione lyase family enzyme
VSVPLGRITLYVRDVERTIAFYVKHFGFEVLRLEGDRIVELVGSKGGANLLIHPAAKSVKTGQVTVKLVFDVEDVLGFAEKAAKSGLKFGAPHKGDGYIFANAKDPDGNSIAISSRIYAKRGARPTGGPVS